MDMIDVTYVQNRCKKILNFTLWCADITVPLLGQYRGPEVSPHRTTLRT